MSSEETVKSEDDLLQERINTLHSGLSDISVELTGIFWEPTREQVMQRREGHPWSPLEILVHMRQMSEVYAERVKRVLREDNDELPTLYDYSDEKQMSKIHLEDESVRANIKDFMTARSELLNAISFIPLETWKKEICIHEALGKLTLLQLLEPLAEREKGYLSQLIEMLGT